MNITNLFKSSLGKKFIMAITGLAMFGFVVLHLAGNLQVFLGWDELNRYGDFLQTNLELIWPARLVLLLMLGLHIWAAVELTAANRAARPKPYAHTEIVAASYASRTMFMSGVIIFAFIIYHLLHFTVEAQAINLTGRDFTALHDAKGRHDVFAMMVLGFQKPIVSIFYIIAMFLLCFHLSHGLGAMCQSLGFKNQAYAPIISGLSKVISWLIFAGYISIPIAVMMGYGDSHLQEVLK